MLHGQFNNSIISTQPTRNDFDKLASLYELSLFKFNTNLDPSLNPCQNFPVIKSVVDISHRTVLNK